MRREGLKASIQCAQNALKVSGYVVLRTDRIRHTPNVAAYVSMSLRGACHWLDDVTARARHTKCSGSGWCSKGKQTLVN